MCPSVLPENLRVFVENSGKKILAKIVSACGIWSKEFGKNFIFDKSARKNLRVFAYVDIRCRVFSMWYLVLSLRWG
jgi:hypothetical protein